MAMTSGTIRTGRLVSRASTTTPRRRGATTLRIPLAGRVGSATASSRRPGGGGNKDYSPYFDHNLCSICLEEYEPGEQIRVLPCQHTYHSNCIFPWLTERSPTCPLCKAMFEAVQYEEDEEQRRAEEEEGDAEAGRGGEEDAAVATGGRGEEETALARGGAPVAAAQHPLPEPLDDEPAVHRGRRREKRRQQMQERAERRGNHRSATRPAGRDGDAHEAAEAAPASGGDAEESAIDISTHEMPSTSAGLRGRFWGLFGAAVSSPAADATTTISSLDLEEPLLTSGVEGEGAGAEGEEENEEDGGGTM